MARRFLLLVCCLLPALVGEAQIPEGWETQGLISPEIDPTRPVAPHLAPGARESEVFRHDCRNIERRRELTLFANGTVRQRRGRVQDLEMQLGDLAPTELPVVQKRLRDIQHQAALERPWPESNAPRGDFSELCEVSLVLDGLRLEYSFDRLQAPPLWVASAEQLAWDLAEVVRAATRPPALPSDFVLKSGDVLRTTDGRLLRFLRETGDGQGLEFETEAADFRIFFRRDDLQTIFVALVERTRVPLWVP
jgi:hypothetical protein